MPVFTVDEYQDKDMWFVLISKNGEEAGAGAARDLAKARRAAIADMSIADFTEFEAERQLLEAAEFPPAWLPYAMGGALVVLLALLIGWKWLVG